MGKLPCCADFLCKNIPGELIHSMRTVCDSIATQVATNEQWKAAYFEMPYWYFNLPANVTQCGDYCGCVMPSVDAVGRYYPFYVLLKGRWRLPEDIGEIDIVCQLMEKLLLGEVVIDDFEKSLRHINASMIDSYQDRFSHWWAVSTPCSFTCTWPDENNIKLMVGLP